MAHDHAGPGDASWPFPGPENQAVICCEHVLDRSRPILRVTHDEEDEDWQFLCGQPHNGVGGRVVCIGCMVSREPGLLELADLPLGWCADRETVEHAWQRSENL